MKKTSFFAMLLCVIMLFACVGCNSSSQEETSSPLIYNKKYYHADYFDRSNAETVYIIFYKDGTGEYYGNGAVYEEYGTVEFTYLLTEDTVHCFYNGGNSKDYEGTNWNNWYWVKEGVLYTETTNAVQYINEDYLSKAPNLGR